MKVSIVTPSYNRGSYLIELYKSLIIQTNFNFEWIIVDDGSTDSTKSIIESFLLDNQIKIYYFSKPNAGKHTAINYILNKNKILNDLVFFVDSDDTLKENAIELILKNFDNIKNKELFSGLCFQRINKKTNKFMCKNFPEHIYDSDIFTLIKKYKVYGDKAEVFFKKDLINYRFPEIKGEKLFSELYIWMELTRKKKMRFINEGIYYCEYLEEGYTKNFNKILKNNLIGMSMYYKKIIAEPRFGIIFRLRALYRYIQIYFIKILNLLKDRRIKCF